MSDEGGRSRSFDELGLAPALLRAVDDTGYDEPTPIQLQAIPPGLAGRDILGCAQTGTGKTAAFALPILQRLAEGPRSGGGIRALILAPTRELAAQIAASFERYGRRTGLRTTVVFGGVSKRPQTAELRRGVDVLVATPGRLLDLMSDRALSLASVEVLVLDEADRMLDMGFIHDVQRVVRAIPRDRQTMLFSATLPEEIRDLAADVLREPVRVAVTPVASTVEATEQTVFAVDKQDKLSLLLTLLQEPSMERVLVFTRTKHGADKVAKKLVRAGVETAALHGNKSQGARERALEGFKRGRTRVIVATDIAARGLDVKGLTHVVNHDIPNEPETYVHRIGRTGRAGAVGVALSFCAPEERDFLSAIERLTRRRLDRVELPSLIEVPLAPAPSRPVSRPAARANGANDARSNRGAEGGARRRRRDRPTRAAEGRDAAAERRRDRRGEGRSEAPAASPARSDRVRSDRGRGEGAGADRGGAERAPAAPRRPRGARGSQAAAVSPKPATPGKAAKPWWQQAQESAGGGRRRSRGAA
ncbi:MAG TPA: DEAD/DEAH box helicase [Thermoanaerobaculia bacterium]|nr:DEAD/DEAH box helicase [Thermoanaerobaculia bacterium]